MATSAIGRVATGVAVAVLVLNALLLGAAGALASRPWLWAAAGACLAAAVLVLLAWRRHTRVLAELADDRQALRDEALAMRDLLRKGPP